MKFIVEILSGQRATGDGLNNAEAWLTTGADGLNSDLARHGRSRLPVFQRVAGPDFHFNHVQTLSGFAIDLAEGQTDLDRAGALLRVIEAKAGLEDGKIKLIAFAFPDLASLADRTIDLKGSPRLFALAFDEERLQNELPRSEISHPAPLIYARARLVADAKKIACTAYLKPLWSKDVAANHSILQQAKADGFDGVIAPSALISMINNA